MSSASSSGANWSTLLEPLRPHENLFRRADDPRLDDSIIPWHGDESLLTPGRPVLLGFPFDEGVRRNGGRVGAAAAPADIRRWLSRLTIWDGDTDTDLARMPPVDLGNIRGTTLEEAQTALGTVMGELLQRGTVPVVIGGGHETAFGHYLGYAAGQRPVGIINIDAHLDVRPLIGDRGHSGSPFRQAIEHPEFPLPGNRYVCLGAQSHAVARDHLDYVRSRGGVVRWRQECDGKLGSLFSEELGRLGGDGCRVYVTVDADAVDARAVPGVSAPNVLGLSPEEVAACGRAAGESPAVSSFEVVEINPQFDLDGVSARWAALLLWHFLAGLARRPRP
jgi:formiminoglutamase